MRRLRFTEMNENCNLTDKTVISFHSSYSFVDCIDVFRFPFSLQSDLVDVHIRDETLVESSAKMQIQMTVGKR